MKPTHKQISQAKIIDVDGGNRAYAMTPEGRVFNRFTRQFLSNGAKGAQHVSIYLNRPKRSFRVYIKEWKDILFPVEQLIE